MDWALLLIVLPLIIVFLVVGIQLLRGKWLMLIAGYNTASKQEQTKINGPALGKLVGSLSLFISLLMLLLVLLPLTYITVTVFILLSLSSVIGCLIYENKSDRFKIK